VIELSIDASQFKAILGPLRAMPKKMIGCLLRAGKRAGTAMRTDVAKHVRAVSYLKAADIRGAMRPLRIDSEGSGIRAWFNVGSKNLPADRFRLLPNRVTARKGRPSRAWPEPGFRIGPYSPLMHARGGASRGFIANLNGKKLFTRASRKRGSLRREYGWSVQYFASFDRVKESATKRAMDVFEERLLHEVRRALGGLR